jgi:hypothetical protein
MGLALGEVALRTPPQYGSMEGLLLRNGAKLLRAGGDKLRLLAIALDQKSMLT